MIQIESRNFRNRACGDLEDLLLLSTVTGSMNVNCNAPVHYSVQCTSGDGGVKE